MNIDIKSIRGIVEKKNEIAVIPPVAQGKKCGIIFDLIKEKSLFF